MPTINTTPNRPVKSTTQPSSSSALIPVVIPGNISSRTDLSWTEKGVFALVYALSRKSGTCEASNEFLAQRLGLGVRYLPDVIQKLVAKGLIHFLNINQKSRTRRLAVAQDYDALSETVTVRSSNLPGNNNLPDDTATAVSSAVNHTVNTSDHTVNVLPSYGGGRTNHTVPAVTSINSEYKEKVNLSSDAQGASEVKEVLASPLEEVGEEWLVKAEQWFKVHGVSSPRPNAVRRQAIVFRSKGASL